MSKMRNTVREAVQRRLANDAEWAATELGQTLQLLLDTGYVSIPVMSDVLSTPEHPIHIRSIHRWPRQPSLYPKMSKFWLERFHQDLRRFRTAVVTAIEAGEFEPDEDGITLKERSEVAAILKAYMPERD